MSLLEDGLLGKEKIKERTTCITVHNKQNPLFLFFRIRSSALQNNIPSPVCGRYGGSPGTGQVAIDQVELVLREVWSGSVR